MRVGLYTDYPYRQVGGRLSADRAFAVFANRLGRALGGLTLIGRLEPSDVPLRHPADPGFEFVALPYYETLARPGAVLRAASATLRRFWRALDELDCIWVLGPHAFGILFALLAALRGKRVVLGIRQDMPAYTKHRHPGSRGLLAAAWVLELGFRALAVFCPTVAVGPDLASHYRHSRHLLETTVSLVDAGDVIAPEDAARREYGDELMLLSVGRLESEKNPLLLADVLAGLHERDPRWRMVVCGEGPLESDLAARLERLGVAEHARLRGYVPFGSELMSAYRESHAFLHVSFTEGFPQVLLEAFAAGVPVVATDVGGIAASVDGAVALIPAEDPAAAVAAIERVAREPEVRAALVAAGNAYVSERTITAEAKRVARFLEGSA